jgi:hypothetical protein
MAIFSNVSATFCAEYGNFHLADKFWLRHIVAARYRDFDREAAALPGRFLPELGRSSERPFFLA